ncbi:MAG: fumarylacetoacetate hydrolase family protein [Candidatus Palauibacterales bacterium]|nr:fumarylacetoacetate hydrolase family protein [Candidatus Palauibacterales bacterium]
MPVPELGPGLARPGKIICVGRNYRDHAEEMDNPVPERPLLFQKPVSAVIGPGEPIRLPGESDEVEHEAEIGVVVGRRLSRADEEEARAAVAGVTCVNDVTARDLQRTESQWARAKGFDSFCPVGPRLHALRDPDAWRELEVRCRVNGEERQSGRAADMAFGLPAVLSYVSRAITLEPGDLVATGTPSGVGPLRPGDRVEVEVSGVGVLRNPVEERSGAGS